ncbi:arginine--tRNA ligase [Spirochaeta dissipatitropha]
MKEIKKLIEAVFHAAVSKIAEDKGIAATDIDFAQIIPSTPPNSEMGDLAFPVFPLAKIMRMGPPQIAALVADELMSASNEFLESAVSAGPYVNVRFKRSVYIQQLSAAVTDQKDAYGSSDYFKNRKIMVEFSCPNTNKPLHLGHLRNNALGASVARLCAAAGADVERVNLINDRGVHICKSMLAYSKFGEGKTPESENKKPDHFVGDYYVKFSQWAKEHPEADSEAAELLQKWESGEPETIELWKKMNGWALEGINETYKHTGIEFDRLYYESQTYLSGKSEILDGLDRGVFYRNEDGAVMVDLSDINLDTKVLLRKDGTSLYLTQDIGTAIARHNDWPFEQMIYVVGSEQQYHFKVLFHVLELLGFDWAQHLSHLSYGMVNLPDGKMKSREGTVVDADDLIASLEKLALKELMDRGRDSEGENAEEIAHSIALGALHYYLLAVTPVKDMVFNPAESLSFNGNTGPYLQYVGARISSLMRKADASSLDVHGADLGLLTLDSEWDILKSIGRFPELIEKAADTLSPSEITGYLYELGKSFSRYYHDTPVLQDNSPDVSRARLALCRMVLQVMKNGFYMLGIPFLERM